MHKANSSRITVRAVDELRPGDTLWDTTVKGFGVRCQRRDKVYVLKVRFAGRQTYMTIGAHGSPWTPETARHEAQRLWGEVRSGRNPAQARAAAASAPTIGDLCDRYFEEHARLHKKPSSQISDRRNIDNHIKPLLGRRFISEITRVDIKKAKRDICDGKTAKGRKANSSEARVRGGPIVANRCLALLSKMFSLAEIWGLTAPYANPVRKVTRFRENRIERYLRADELKRLSVALREAEISRSESIFAIAAIRLLMLTGARVGEILCLKWAYIDETHRLFALPDSKTGRKVIYLSAPVMELLATIPRVHGNPHVIVGKEADGHFIGLHRPWHRIRSAAGLEDVRLHDLRHTFASAAVSTGHTLPIIGKLLGHTHSVTTERYAHLANDPVREANEAIANHISSFMG
jgi:integrase